MTNFAYVSPSHRSPPATRLVGAALEIAQLPRPCSGEPQPGPRQAIPADEAGAPVAARPGLNCCPRRGSRTLVLWCVAVAVSVLAGTLVMAGPASAKTLTVCPSGCAFHKIGPAVSAARSGDTVRITAGEYRGGFTIDKNLSVVGAGPRATVIRGGGPVITVGQFLAQREPTVAIKGVTITGGFTRSSPEASNIAAGGGISILPSAHFRAGGTLMISDSVIAHNRVSPASSEPVGPPCPDGRKCPFAAALGGGIYNGGKLTLSDTTVSNNSASGPTSSDSDGGGIANDSGGSLTVRDSILKGNVASASGPNGRFAEGGAIFAGDGESVSIVNSRISGNSAVLSSSLPYFIGHDQTLQIAANSGGIHIGNSGALIIKNTSIDRNRVSVTDLQGEPEAFDAAVCDCGSSSLTLTNSRIAGNELTARVGSAADVFSCCGFAAGGTLEFDGQATINNTRVRANTTTVSSPSGAAIADGAVFSAFSSPSAASLISDTTISGNAVTAASTSGTARVLGAGVTNTAALGLIRDHIAENSGVARAPAGTAQGAGIWNGQFPGGPPVRLTIERTNVTHNALHGSSAITLQGGGLYSATPVTLSASTFTDNTPNNCFGIGC